MTDLRPLSANPSGSSVLLLDGSRSYLDLQETAEYRLMAARDLLASFAYMEGSCADGRYLANVAEAANLLLSDAYDLLRAAREAVQRDRLSTVD
ncbi:hypothetical protein [Metapseudomonas otitidis]|uniref:hypothetical protein n=1 Tax=Metapseudomonas otitidis TaxID=319939 RepID=UPI0013F626F1|nr:hypothetical protein [Pseudomonas otitidis]